MSRVTLDPEAIAKLAGYESVEVVDVNGKLVGVFTPAPPELTEAERARLLGLFDLEKAKQVAETERGQGRTTAEVLERLRSLGQPK